MKALVTDDMAYMAREHEADCTHSLGQRPGSFTAELAPGARPPHDATLEPKDETIAEVQSFVAASRQASYEGLRTLGHLDLMLALSDTLRSLIDQPSPAHAIALAGFALRLREEHLV